MLNDSCLSDICKLFFNGDDTGEPHFPSLGKKKKSVAGLEATIRLDTNNEY